jgi:cob(I)alamin adenosyltransferase
MSESPGEAERADPAAGAPEAGYQRRGSAQGDAGYTDLLGRRRVAKHDPRIEAIGLVDEATSLLGLARSGAQEERTRRLAQQAQQDLYEVMAELAFPPEHAQARRIGPEHVEWLDRCVGRVQAPFLSLTKFVLPGGCPGSAGLDVARAAVRTAERQLARLAHEGLLPNPTSMGYLNRLSLLLYYLARAEDAAAGVDFDLAGAPAVRPEA